MSEEFDFNTALAALQNGQDLTGKDGILTPLIKQLTEAALKAELETHLEDAETPNRKNDFTTKTVKSSSGNFDLQTPRDRSGSFEPQLIKKYQTHLTDEIERKLIAMFGLGMSYNDMASHIADMYGINVSNATISSITDKLIPELKQWQQRPLDGFYPFICWMRFIIKSKKMGGMAARPFIQFWRLTWKAKKKYLVYIYLKVKAQIFGCQYSPI